jgi:hypothetical protein
MRGVPHDRMKSRRHEGFNRTALVHLMRRSGRRPLRFIVYRTILWIMSHTIRGKVKLGRRVARIRGQIDAVARALETEAECGEVLRLIASARGAMTKPRPQTIWWKSFDRT